MNGMNLFITACADTLGCIEFNNDFLARAGTDIPQLLSSLIRKFNVYYLVDQVQAVRFRSLDMGTLERFFATQDIHVDFVLARDEHTLR
ncbi:hypothetical protein [Paenibacillus alvei]|uniref:Uncharacterized protein n=1 Tax=Paenibacillus alvei TaxID=44250 RepID=A0AAP7DHZ6_PAEAL|nr:hypothetical protein [Paenibacillus alvei]NOJ70360.1 hypothetical protein [Paenibacillus alvei]